MREMVRSHDEKQRQRKALLGEVREGVHGSFDGQKIVAVGQSLYYAPANAWRTFADFLMDYIKHVMTAEWGNAEIAKPFEERHPVMKWYDGMCRFQQKQERAPDGVFYSAPNGAMNAYVLLAYDLYVLDHHSSLQSVVVKRLKDKNQFQGARHELFVAATCISAGFDIEYEDERDGTHTHPEFVAKHRTTGETYSVEATSRHRAQGNLGKRVEPKLRLERLIAHGIRKESPHPRVVFVGLIVPPQDVPLCHERWRARLSRAVEHTRHKDSARNPFELIVFSRHNYGHDEPDGPAPAADTLARFGRPWPNLQAVPAGLMALYEAAAKYGHVPQTFEES
ncbi:MAG: hypothetical protein IMZ62_04355 [Chloroflexi bacterium]|nr:hypothetical protein [Chloroflexota bacterium]